MDLPFSPRERLPLTPVAACLAVALALGTPAGAEQPFPVPAWQQTTAPWHAPAKAPTASRLRRGADFSAGKPVAQGARHSANTRLLHYRAPTATVANCDDSGTGSLRDAVAAAASGDTIDLSLLTCSVITLTSGEIAVTMDDLALQGPGAATLSIDGDHRSRVFNHSGAGTLQIRGLAISHGQFSRTGRAHGGCIYSSSPDATVALVFTTVSGCMAITGANGASSGGGVFAYGDLAVTDSVLTGNIAESTGAGSGAAGGGAAAYGDIYLLDSKISYNTASVPDTGVFAWGGGLASSYPSLSTTIVGSTFSGNQAVGHAARGGGMKSANTSIDRSTFVNNDVTGSYDSYASAILVVGDLTLMDSIIRDNTATAVGWDGSSQYALRIEFGNVSITGTTVSGNHAVNCAGIGLASSFASKPLLIANSTISGNVATGAYGALCVNDVSAPLHLFNTTIAFNSNGSFWTLGPGSGAGISFAAYNQSTSADFESSIIANNVINSGSILVPADIDGRPGVTISGANNLILATSVTVPIDTLTVDPLLGPLRDNGGPNLTHVLMAGSPAIDSGNNVAVFDFDQRGVGFPRVVGAAADIGAIEFQPMVEIIFRNGFDP